MTELFKATIVPGILMTVSFMLLHRSQLKNVLEINTTSGKHEYSNEKDPEIMANAKAYIKDSIPALIMPAIVLDYLLQLKQQRQQLYIL